jgi:endogenous inhibitor of DNA gyrase (YacG/DUF329 family)
VEKNDWAGQDGICPHCRAKVEWLVFAEDRTVTGEFRDGIHYEVDSWPIGDNGTSYECPKCGRLLFRDERDALAFLGREMRRHRNGRTSGTGEK